MLTIATKRPIAVFDIDGVLIQNPSQSRRAGKNEPPGPTIPDPLFWTKHWKKRDAAAHQDMFDLLFALQDAQWLVILLTGRPIDHRSETVATLAYHGVSCYGPSTDVVTDVDGFAHLVMVESGNYGSSADFKVNMIRKWKSDGANIKFLIEDYKPNAEAVREHIPVLLYERYRP